MKSHRFPREMDLIFNAIFSVVCGVQAFLESSSLLEGEMKYQKNMDLHNYLDNSKYPEKCGKFEHLKYRAYSCYFCIFPPSSLKKIEKHSSDQGFEPRSFCSDGQDAPTELRPPYL